MIDIPSNLTEGDSVYLGDKRFIYNEGKLVPYAVTNIGTELTSPKLGIEELGDVVKILIPESITKRQAKQQLLLDGKLNQVQEVIDSISDETERMMAQLYWDDSTEFERIHPTLVWLGTALGLTEAELDMMFINASKL